MSADFWAGYISGAAGILIGNPLDLVKVRLQAGGSGSGVGASTAAARSATTASSPGNTPFRRLAALATGSAAPVLGYGALNSLLFVSYRQAEALLTPPSSSSSSASGPTASGGGASSSASAQPSAAATWMAGAIAGLATWIVSAPTELIKCRAQLAGTLPPPPGGTPGATPRSPPSSWKIARQVWAAEGVRGFFLGGTVTALRDSIGYGFYFWSYLLATDAWRRWSREPEPGAGAGADAGADAGYSSNPNAATLLCGGFAGIVTWATVFPLDVIKTRVQAQGLPVAATAATARAAAVAAAPPDVRSGRRPPSPTPATPLCSDGGGGNRGSSALPSSRSPPGGPGGRRLSSWQVTRQAYREGGFGVFFRGLSVCSARAFVVNAVQWAVYEWIIRELGAKGVSGPGGEGGAIGAMLE